MIRLAWPRRPGWQAARVLLCGAAAGLGVALPDWMYGAPQAWMWALLAAVAAALVALCCASGEVLRCVAALAAGMALDFAAVPPAVALALCGAGDYHAALAAHLHWFPATTVAMLALPLLRGWHGPNRTWLARALAELLLMLAAMPAAMAALRGLAAAVDWPWGAAALVCAMTLAMLGAMASASWKFSGSGTA